MNRNFLVIVGFLVITNGINNFTFCQESKIFKVTSKQNNAARIIAENWIIKYSDSIFIKNKEKFKFDPLKYYPEKAINDYIDSMEIFFKGNKQLNYQVFKDFLDSSLYDWDANIYVLHGHYLKEEYRDFCDIYFHFGIQMNLLYLYYETSNTKCTVYYDDHGKGNIHFNKYFYCIERRTLGGRRDKP